MWCMELNNIFVMYPLVLYHYMVKDHHLLSQGKLSHDQGVCLSSTSLSEHNPSVAYRWLPSVSAYIIEFCALALLV